MYFLHFSSFLKCPECLIAVKYKFLHLLNDIEVMGPKTINHALSVVYILINYGFLTNQRARWVLSISIFIIKWNDSFVVESS